MRAVGRREQPPARGRGERAHGEVAGLVDGEQAVVVAAAVADAGGRRACRRVLRLTTLCAAPSSPGERHSSTADGVGHRPAEPHVPVAGRRLDALDRGRRGVVAQPERAGLADVAGLVRARAGDAAEALSGPPYVAEVQPDEAGRRVGAGERDLQRASVPAVRVGRATRRRAGDDRRRHVDLERSRSTRLGRARRSTLQYLTSCSAVSKSTGSLCCTRRGRSRPSGIHRPSATVTGLAYQPPQTVGAGAQHVTSDRDAAAAGAAQRARGRARRSTSARLMPSVSRRRWPISPRLPAAATSSASAARRASAVASVAAALDHEARGGQRGGDRA